MDGLETEWRLNGRKYFEIHWKNGKKDGLETWWSESGKKVSETHWKNGKKDGVEEIK